MVGPGEARGSGTLTRGSPLHEAGRPGYFCPWGRGRGRSPVLCELVFGSKGENGGSVPAFSPFPAPLAVNHAPAVRRAGLGGQASSTRPRAGRERNEAGRVRNGGPFSDSQTAEGSSDLGPERPRAGGPFPGEGDGPFLPQSLRHDQIRISMKVFHTIQHPSILSSPAPSCLWGEGTLL